MRRLARFVITHRWWVIGAWLLLAIAGGIAAPHATSRLSYDFGLPGQRGYEANVDIAGHFGGTGGQNAPVLLVSTDDGRRVPDSAARTLRQAVLRAAPGARVATWTEQPALRSRDGRTAVVLVYPRAIPGADAYVQALPALEAVAARAPVPTVVTGQDALSGEGGGADVLAETIFGGLAALVVLVVVFGSFLAITPLVVAAGSILTTFLLLWGLTGLTEVSFVVQYLLALIGLGVGIDYALLIVTRWREQRGDGASTEEAIEATLATAGRSVLFSGVTVAISLAALIALPVPFLRSVGFTGLLIPVLSVAAALTLLPALLLVAGDRLSWPHRRGSRPDSRAWHRVGTAVVRHRWVSVVVGVIVLLALAAPVLGLRLGAATNSSLASTGGAAGRAITAVDRSGIGSGISQPIEIRTDDPQRVAATVGRVDGIAAAIAPDTWRRDGIAVVDAWTTADASSASGSAAVQRAADAARRLDADAGGIPVQNRDFVHTVYGNAWWVATIIAVVTFALLAAALRSIALPLKALALNVLSVGAAYGLTVLIWQHGLATHALFGQNAAGAVTVWVPIAVFAFLFGLSMDYEVFLLSRIREEHDRGASTDSATVAGLSRTGRLVSSGALILFLAFVSLSRVPQTDVKILATGLAFGIILDATIVRGVLAPALVAALGHVNWWWPARLRRRRV